ncbi:MAG: hypothetical protein HWE22_18855 [Flavobacteriales bacterium]|nr:hypothetical protein [Flavobacteriales bacterium]
MKKFLFFLIVMPLLLAGCSNEYEVEDALYAYIETKYADESINLENTLDSLEKYYVEEGVIASGSPSDLRDYFQQNIDEGQLRISHNDQARALLSRVSFSFNELEKAALRQVDGETFDASKFGIISNLIEEETTKTGQIASSTVALPYLEVLSVKDFEHPFYRSNVLLFLHMCYFHHYVKYQEYIREMPKKVEYVVE